MSRFPFAIFWRVLPYIALGTYYIAVPMTQAAPDVLWPLLALLLALTVSLYKADYLFQRREPLIYIAPTLQLIELMLLTLVGFHHGGLMALWLAVPIVDLSWSLNRTHKRNWPLALLSLIALGISIASQHQNQSLVLLWWSLLVFAGAVGLGWSLGDFDQRRRLAQQYYDQLRISEEALRTAHSELESYYLTLEEVSTLRERSRISRELHDSVGHALSTAHIQLQMLTHKLKHEGSSHVSGVEQLSTFIQESLASTRRVVHDMGAAPIDGQRFRHELATLCVSTAKLTDTKITLVMPSTHWELNQDQHLGIYRMIQESLTNALRHGKATEVRVILAFSKDRLKVSIMDNGTSSGTATATSTAPTAGPTSPSPQITPGFGLTTMAQRAAALCGEMTYQVAPQGGFTVSISIPKEKN